MIRKFMILCISFLAITAQAQDVLETLRAAEDQQVTTQSTEKSAQDRLFRRGGGRGNDDVIGPIVPYPPQPGPGGGYYPPPRPPRPPSYPDYGSRVRCSATDNGWEEHWGGHASCGECLARHGNCTETCSQDIAICAAEGIDYRGQRVTIEARGYSQYQAEDEAYNRCLYRASNCRVTTCRESSETVSRRSCR